MSRNYKFHNPDGVYFVSFAVVNWLDVFAGKEYKSILIESLRYCQQKKGMEIFAWCIMSSHVHLVFRRACEQKPELLLGDFKRFTGKSIVKAIIDNPKESRKEFLPHLPLRSRFAQTKGRRNISPLARVCAPCLACICKSKK
ncbi:transposase [Gaoshiqia sp. Z1-71]|uniref:transposase n=1 Tax=Gaoshiqia hydrogeniformans TaxID=3290090 RepID=UPI003BF8B3AD